MNTLLVCLLLFEHLQYVPPCTQKQCVKEFVINRNNLNNMVDTGGRMEVDADIGI